MKPTDKAKIVLVLLSAGSAVVWAMIFYFKWTGRM